MTTEAKTLPEGDYFKLVGLMTLAREHTATLDTLERAMLAVTRESESVAGGTHTADTLYERDEPRAATDALLKKLDITVEAEGD